MQGWERRGSYNTHGGGTDLAGVMYPNTADASPLGKQPRSRVQQEKGGMEHLFGPIREEEDRGRNIKGA